jgi:hypothetical protein
MDAVKAETEGQRETSNAKYTSAAYAVSDGTSASRMAKTERSSSFNEGVTPADMSDTVHDDSLNSTASASAPNSPSVIYLEPGFSLVADSVVIVKSDYCQSKPQTYTYNFSIVNNTSEPIELSYQPIMRQQPLQKDHLQPLGTDTCMEPSKRGILYTSDHSRQSHMYKPESLEEFPSALSATDHGKEIKTEPVDYSITMNESLDTDTDTESLQNQDYEEETVSLRISKMSLIFGLHFLFPNSSHTFRGVYFQTIHTLNLCTVCI